MSKAELTAVQSKAKEIHDDVADTWLIDGFSMDYWEKALTVVIPQDSDSPAMLEACTHANKVLNVAFNYLARAEADADAAALLYKRKYNSHIDGIVAKHKFNNEKVPAAATLTALAESALTHDVGALAYLETRTKYWKRMVDKVKSSVKLLETMTWNLSTEARIASGQT